MNRVTHCTMTRTNRTGGPREDWSKWQRTVDVEFDWSDGTEAGLDRIWDIAVDKYIALTGCPRDQVLEQYRTIA